MSSKMEANAEGEKNPKARNAEEGNPWALWFSPLFLFCVFMRWKISINFVTSVWHLCGLTSKLRDGYCV
jgi:hypothetical protein